MGMTMTSMVLCERGNWASGKAFVEPERPGIRDPSADARSVGEGLIPSRTSVTPDPGAE